MFWIVYVYIVYLIIFSCIYILFLKEIFIIVVLFKYVYIEFLNINFFLLKINKILLNFNKFVYCYIYVFEIC